MRGFALLLSWSWTRNAVQMCWRTSRSKDSHSPSVSASISLLSNPKCFYFPWFACLTFSLALIPFPVCKTRVAHGTNSHEVRDCRAQSSPTPCSLPIREHKHRACHRIVIKPKTAQTDKGLFLMFLCISGNQYLCHACPRSITLTALK